MFLLKPSKLALEMKENKFSKLLFLLIIININTPILFAQNRAINIWLNTRIPVITDQNINISIFELRHYNELSSNENYFLTTKGQNVILTSYRFFINFIKEDIPAIKRVLINPDDERHHFNYPSYRYYPYVLNDVRYLILTRIRFYSTDEIYVEYSYGLIYNEYHPNYWITMTLIYINNEWKVRNYYYERDY